MRSFVFSEDTLVEIEYDRYHHPHPLVQRKMEVLWLKAHDLPHAQIAKLAGCSLRTVQRYLDDYQEGGLAQIRQLNWAGKPNALAEHRLSLESHFLANPPASAKQARQRIEELTGIRRGLTQVRVFLKKKSG
jgi:transposase